MLLHEILNQTCEKYPGNIAVESKCGQITYKELGMCSDQLAASLMQEGIKAGEPVAILLPKSILAVVCQYGCLKAGACYLPMDVSAPKERLSYIIEQAGIRFLITDGSHYESALSMKNDQMTIFCLKEQSKEDHWEYLQTEKFTAVTNQCESDASLTRECMSKSQITEDFPAYLLYTSGSTGKPKGVTITHKNAWCFIKWAYDYFHVTSEDILSSHAPFYFDLSVFDLYVAMMAGAKLCLLPSGLSAFPVSLISYIREHHITVWYSVPSVLVQMLQYGNPDRTALDSLRCVIYAGEAFPIKYLNEWIGMLPKAKFYNLYGPTETNVITYYPVTTVCEEEVPIGFACPYCKIHVVKEDGTFAGIGERGELVVQSQSLMQGYYRREDLTNQAIRELRMGTVSYGMYYHTGDLVEVVEDGVYRFICRIDHMVKLGGFRVELEEIEAVLSHHPKIQACMVRIEQQPSAHLQLLVQSQAEKKDIIAYAKKYLPEYMVPYDIRFLKAFSYTERGKIDRHAYE